MNYPLNYDDSGDEWLALAVTVVIGVIMSVGAYFVIKSVNNKDNKKQPKVEKVQKNIQYDNMKHNNVYHLNIKNNQNVR